MDFDDLIVFRSVVRCGSMVRAAEQTGFSQPAISRRIQRLEETLGQRLLERSTSPAGLTEAGKTFLDFSESVLAALDRLQEALNQPTMTGELRLASSSAPADLGITDWVGEFVAQFPGVEVRWVSASSQMVEAAVRDGRAAIGFMGSRPEDCCLAVQPFGEDEIVLAVPNTPAFAHLEDPLDPARLPEVPLVQREQASGTLATVARALARAGIRRPLNVVAEVDSAHALQEAVAAGWGAGFVSAGTLKRHADGRIRPLHLADLPLRRPLYMVWDPVHLLRRPLVARFQQFVLTRADNGASRGTLPSG